MVTVTPSHCHRVLMLPWLLVSMLELILLGGPLVVLTDLLVLHLSLQGHLLPGLLLTNIPALLTILLLAVWCLVLAAYVSLGQAHRACQADSREVALKGEAEAEVEAELSSHHSRHSQYTQFYKPRHRHARPHQPTGVNLYPTPTLPPLSSIAG